MRETLVDAELRHCVYTYKQPRDFVQRIGNRCKQILIHQTHVIAHQQGGLRGVEVANRVPYLSQKLTVKIP